MIGLTWWRRRKSGDLAGALAKLGEAIVTLEKRRRILIGLLSSLKERREHLKSRMATAKANGDRDRLSMQVTEYKDVVAMIKLLEAAELSLQKAVLRLENVRLYITIRSEIATALNTIRGISGILEDVPGSFNRVADEISDTLSWLNGELMIPDDQRIDVLSPIGDRFDVQDIIDDAVDEVSEIVMKKFESPELQDDGSIRDEAIKILAAAKDVHGNGLDGVLANAIRDRRRLMGVGIGEEESPEGDEVAA